jgi:hypothetical protein
MLPRKQVVTYQTLSAKELDAQSPIRIDRWVDAGSEECLMLDPDYDITKMMMRVGFKDPPFLFTDSAGRIWGTSDGDKYFPLHFENRGKLIGYRLPKKAAN